MGNMVTLPTTDLSAYGAVPKANPSQGGSQPPADITISPLKPPDNALPEIPSVVPAQRDTSISAAAVAEAANAPSPVIEPVSLPSIAEMEVALNKSGLLLPDLHVVGTGPIVPTAEPSPLASLQPGYKPPEHSFFSAPPSTTNLNTVTHSTVPTSVGQNSLTHTVVARNGSDSAETGMLLQLPLEPIFALVLSAQAAIGISQAAYFGLHQYRPFELEMIAGHVTAGDLQTASLKAFGIVALSGVSLLFAVLVLLYRRQRQVLTILLGCIMLIVANVAVQNMFAPPELLSGNPASLLRAWMANPL